MDVATRARSEQKELGFSFLTRENTHHVKEIYDSSRWLREHVYGLHKDCPYLEWAKF
jgi:hypothetical protein